MVEAMEIKKGYKKSEVGEIPSDWEVKKLGDGINLLSGHHVLAQYCNTEGNGFPYITGPADFPSGTIQHSKFTVKPTTICRSNDILVTVKGSGSGTIVLADAEYCISRQLMAVRVTDWDNRYIYYSLMQDESVFGAVATGLIPGLSRSDILNKLIPLPPIKAEQIAIATALNDADALITQLEKLIAKKRNIKQGAMQELLKPKEGWEVKKLGDVFKFLNTGNNSRSDLFESGEVEYIHYGDIHTKWKTFLDCSKSELPFIDKAKVHDLPFLDDGDLVIADASEDYDGLGACVEIKNIGKREIVAGLHTLLLRGDKNILADGFKGYMRDYHGMKDSLIRLSTGISVFGISKTNLKKVEILIPSTIEEQTRIAQILSDMDTEIEALEKKLEKYKMIKQGMMQNLLTGKIRLV